MAKILVTGAGGPAGSAVTEMLVALGHVVIAADMREIESPAQAVYLVPAALEAGFLPALLRVAETEHVDLVIPTVTEELPVVADGWSALTRIPAVISAPGAVRIADDKYLTALRLAECGVPVPRFALPSQLASPAALEQAIGWPCISKPRRGRGGRGVTVRYTHDWPEIAALGDGYILQEFAPGVDYAPNVFIGRDEPSFAVVLEKTELKEGLVGNAKTTRRVEGLEDVAAVAVAAASAAGLTGPQDVDIRRRLDGQPVVLEINARFGANIRRAPEVLAATLRSFGI